MRLSFLIREKLVSLTGYWVYKKKHLPAGINLFYDIENYFGADSIRTIFDIGGNVGQSVKAFRKEYPQSKIYSFEPVESTFKELLENSKDLKDVVTENIGFGSSVGEYKMELISGNGGNSLVPELNNLNHENITVVKIDIIDEYLSKNKINKIDLLKTDTEGFDLEVLKGAHDSLKNNKIKLIYSEVGLYKEDKRHTSLFEMIEFLKQYNYSFFALYEVFGESLNAVYGNALFVNGTEHPFAGKQ